MNKTDVILRIKKTIVYLDNMLVNFPKSEMVLKTRISNTMYDMLELCYMAISYKNGKEEYIKKALIKMKMLDFYLKMGFDKNVVSHKNIKNLGIHLRDITQIFNMWLSKNEEVK